MRKFFYLSLSILCCLALFLPSITNAHQGRTDSNGDHTYYTNRENGDWNMGNTIIIMMGTARHLIQILIQNPNPILIQAQNQNLIQTLIATLSQHQNQTTTNPLQKMHRVEIVHLNEDSYRMKHIVSIFKKEESVPN